jgi:membrane-associated protease RseP (regulator of RpoE activity)
MEAGMKTGIRTLLAAALLGVAAGAAAQDAAAPHPAAERMLQGELRDVLNRMIAAGAFGTTDPERIALTLTLPAERYLDLGLLIDSRGAARDGVAVLGTLPGAPAQALGVRAGDRITAVNGAALRGADAVARLRAALDGLRDGGTLTLDVVRDGQALRLAGPVTPRYIPAVRLELGEADLVASTGGAAVVRATASATPAPVGGCGRISTFHVAPRSEDLYEAKVLSIDGSIPGPATQHTYRVAPGRHAIEVAERIDDRDLATVHSRARRHRNKTLELLVEPGTTYLVAARFNEDRRDAVADGGYWDPVVWKTVAEPCR